MRPRFHTGLCCAAFGLLWVNTAPAQEIGPESFATGFESSAGYIAGNAVPGQPGAWPEQWYSWYGDQKAVISTAQAHSGSQAVEYPGTNYTEIQHIGLHNMGRRDHVTPFLPENAEFLLYLNFQILLADSR